MRRTGEYVIEAGDVLAMRVVGQDGLTTRGRVRADGRISLPLVGDVEAVSRTPVRLGKELEARIKPFMVAPSVSIAVEESLPVQVSVVGEVAHPGVYAVAPDAGVLWAIAGAGGPTEYATRDRIFVVRASQGRTARIRFTYDRLTRGVLPDAFFALRPGDAVVVE